ncbi:MAG: c-type cytochrome biogenesis protein CcmI [Candidatus Accumulibacter phosphatis]|uniref:C-type cytochrome biogenesis protein CcmI n=1 Tax=Candidatus Accumulibacter phosphatis TaxID=327160 RepID=A0A6A7RX76_9PROT|nr:c-type cytochrome biogenesis protein CcmI [Candidatus Accumulibacter phosphatis]
MTSFILFAVLLVVAVIAILLPPLLRAPKPSAGADHREANLAIFRDQLAELERERDNGALDLADFEQAQNELQRRLLDEVQPRASAPSEARPGRKTALALLVVLPLAAAGGYALLGNQQALDPLQRQARITPQQIEGMVAGLVEKLKANPDDSKGWLMLARSYKVLERFPQAADAYSRAGALVNQDAALLADYAEVLSRATGGELQGKPGELIDQALKIDPDEPQALLLAGAAASERRQFTAAADYWARLLAQLEPGSQEATTIAAAVDRARAIAAQSALGEPAGKTSVASGSGAVSGEVTLSGEVAGQARPDDVLFVFARAEEGPRMPLAATRARVGDLPLHFRFDDSMALPGGKKLSDFKTVSIEARVAKAGKAKSSSGDLFGTLSGVKPGSQGLRLLIDQVQP